jgi:hypothetical protein
MPGAPLYLRQRQAGVKQPADERGSKGVKAPLPDPGLVGYPRASRSRRIILAVSFLAKPGNSGPRLPVNHFLRSATIAFGRGELASLPFFAFSAPTKTFLAARSIDFGVNVAISPGVDRSSPSGIHSKTSVGWTKGSWLIPLTQVTELRESVC